jgi:predicted RNA-binding protein YlqC (UPF0109 family)
VTGFDPADDGAALDEADDADEVDEVDDSNQVVGAVSRDVLDYLAKAIVEDPEAVMVEVEEGRRDSVVLRLHVAPDDMGRVIGRRGRVAQAIRTVVRAAGAGEGVDAQVDIVD